MQDQGLGTVHGAAIMACSDAVVGGRKVKLVMLDRGENGGRYRWTVTACNESMKICASQWGYAEEEHARNEFARLTAEFLPGAKRDDEQKT